MPCPGGGGRCLSRNSAGRASRFPSENPLRRSTPGCPCAQLRRKQRPGPGACSARRPRTWCARWWRSWSGRGRIRDPSASRIPTTSPFSNSPATATTPMASRLFVPVFERAAGAGVDDVDALAAGRSSRSSVAGAWRHGPGRVCRPARRPECGSAARAGPEAMIDRAAGVRDQPRRLELAVHSTGPPALGSGRPGRDGVVEMRDQRDAHVRRRRVPDRPVQPVDHAEDDQQRRLSRFVTIAASWSLSPNLISSTLIVSFSLMIGTAPHSNSAVSVFAHVEIAGTAVEVFVGQQSGRRAGHGAEGLRRKRGSGTPGRWRRRPGADGDCRAGSRRADRCPRRPLPSSPARPSARIAMTALICSARWSIRAGSSVPSGPVKDAGPHLDHPGPRRYDQLIADERSRTFTIPGLPSAGQAPIAAPNTARRAAPTSKSLFRNSSQPDGRAHRKAWDANKMQPELRAIADHPGGAFEYEGCRKVRGAMYNGSLHTSPVRSRGIGAAV